MSRPRAARPRGARGRPGHRSTVWLAVFAVLAQAVLFEFAMSACGVADAQERAAAGAHHTRHGVPDQAPQGPQHDHDKGCPFCLARAAHQAPSLPAGIALPLPSLVVTFVRLAPRRRVCARRRPARFSSRSPPRRPPLLPVA